MMRVVLGPIPDSLICRADCYSQKYFTSAAPESLLRPLPSDRPPSGSGKRQRGKLGDRRPYPLKRKRLSLSRSGLLPSHQLSRREENAKSYYLTHGADGVEPTAMSSASASGSARAAIVEDFRPRDEVTSSSQKRALNWPAGASSAASVRAVRRVKSLADIVKPSENHEDFLDLLRRLLSFEPRLRCTASDALSHPFFHEAPTDADIRPSNQGVAPTLSSGGESPNCESQGTLSAGPRQLEGRDEMFAKEGAGPRGQCAGDSEAESATRRGDVHYAAAAQGVFTMASPPRVPTYAEDRSECRATVAEYDPGCMHAADENLSLDADDCTWRSSHAQRLRQAVSLGDQVADALSGPATVQRTASAQSVRRNGPKPGYAGSDISADGLCHPRDLDNEVPDQGDCGKVDGTAVIEGGMTPTPTQRLSCDVSEDLCASHIVALDGPIVSKAVVTECRQADDLDRMVNPCGRALPRHCSDMNDGDEVETQGIPTTGELSDVTYGPNAFVPCAAEGHGMQRLQRLPPMTFDGSTCHRVCHGLDVPQVLP
jgi:hypothetical protein